ncbi:hypothetical protein Tco_1252249 [Tanacetum coccineum]
MDLRYTPPPNKELHCPPFVTIKEEFGGTDDEYDDVAAFQRKMRNAGKPPNFQKHASRELRCVVFEL